MRWILLLVAALVAAVGAAFTVQNSSFTVPLQLDLYFVAWRLRSPVSASALMWGAFAAGLLVGGCAMGFRGQGGARGRLSEPGPPSRDDKTRDPWAG